MRHIVMAASDGNAVEVSLIHLTGAIPSRPSALLSRPYWGLRMNIHTTEMATMLDTRGVKSIVRNSTLSREARLSISARMNPSISVKGRTISAYCTVRQMVSYTSALPNSF